jgi:hypothetical protein
LANLEHPASLNAFQQFRQACSILSETSRATLPAWYQEALDLDFQLHIRIDGQTVSTFFYNRPADEWGDSPPLTEIAIDDEEQTLAFANQLHKKVRELKGNSVGVILHVADEFATAELNPELDNPAALSDLRDTAFNNPAEILDDSSVPPDQASWRVMPYPAAGSEAIGTTITLSRRVSGFLANLRKIGEDKNFPIITHALSAPLVAISGIPTVIDLSGEKPVVCVLQYPWFTVLAFFNEHSDLRLIRTLQHRGMTRPPNLRNALSTTNASLEFVDPDIHLMQFTADADQKLADELGKNFPDSKVEVVKFESVGSLPAGSPEPALAILPAPGEEDSHSHTFGVLRNEKWFLQDFLPPDLEAVELFPSRNEMRLLHYLKLARIAVAAVAVLGLAWLAFGVFSVIRRPEWAFNEGQAKAVQQRLVNLTQERQRLDHWNNLLSDRSKAWTSMEAVARFFPADSGLLLKSFSHTVRPDSAPGQAKVGFVKEWLISGVARDEALTYLNSLNSREGIASKFTEISKATGNLAYDPVPNTRTLVVNVRTKENPKFRQMPAEDIIDSDETTYPFTFSFTITQRFESADVLSIAAAKAP